MFQYLRTGTYKPLFFTIINKAIISTTFNLSYIEFNTYVKLVLTIFSLLNKKIQIEKKLTYKQRLNKKRSLKTIFLRHKICKYAV